MCRFRDIIKQFSHLRYIYDSLNISTPMGREMLLDTPFCKDRDTLNGIYDGLEALMDRDLAAIQSVLAHFRDIRTTIGRVNGSTTLTEVELFELKHFTFYVDKLSQLNIIDIEPVNEVFTILDPDNSGVVNFYIYDSYSETLAELRGKIKQSADDNSKESLYIELMSVEEGVREELSKEINKHRTKLQKAITRVAEIDILVAKCEMIRREGFTRPQFCDYGKTRFENLVNPYLKSIVNDYQPIDISIIAAPTLVTGANMSGKSMLLKSIALAQYLVQFGFYAPASGCSLALVDDIYMLIGDYQAESEGLSSFAAEIVRLSEIVDRVEEGGEYLILLDELARTTSPTEGVAIIEATLDILIERGAMSLITTHYNTKTEGARVLRVRGFVEGWRDEVITKSNLSKFIDYSLYELVEGDEQLSSEALRIAEILEVNKKLINKSKELLCTKRVN